MPVPRYLQEVADGVRSLVSPLHDAAGGWNALADGMERARTAAPATGAAAPASFLSPAPPPGTLFSPTGQPLSTGGAAARVGGGGGGGSRFVDIGEPMIRSFNGGPPMRLSALEENGQPADFGGGPFDTTPRPGWILGGYGYLDPRFADRAPRLSATSSGGGGSGGSGRPDRQVGGLTEAARLAGGINRDFTAPRPGSTASSAAVVSELRTVGRALGAKLDAIRGDLAFRESVPTTRRRFG